MMLKLLIKVSLVIFFLISCQEIANQTLSDNISIKTLLPVVLDTGFYGEANKPCYVLSGPYQNLPDLPKPIYDVKFELNTFPQELKFEFESPSLKEGHLSVYVNSESYTSIELNLNEEHIGELLKTSRASTDNYRQFSGLKLYKFNTLILNLNGHHDSKAEIHLVVNQEDPRYQYCFGHPTYWDLASKKELIEVNTKLNSENLDYSDLYAVKLGKSNLLMGFYAKKSVVDELISDFYASKTDAGANILPALLQNVSRLTDQVSNNFYENVEAIIFSSPGDLYLYLMAAKDYKMWPYFDDSEQYTEIGDVLSSPEPYFDALSISRHLIYVAQESIKSNKYDKAEFLLEEALKLTPENFSAKYSLGVAYANKNKYQDALNMFLVLEKEEPENLALLKNIALTYSYLKQCDKAKPYYEKAQIEEYECPLYEGFRVVAH